jgi:hypothetical protein
MEYRLLSFLSLEIIRSKIDEIAKERRRERGEKEKEKEGKEVKKRGKGREKREKGREVIQASATVAMAASEFARGIELAVDLESMEHP